METPADREAPHFGLGRAQIQMGLGFLLTIPLADFLLHRSPYRLLVPEVHMDNQVQLFARAVASDREEVLILGSSRVQAGIAPGPITKYLSQDETRPRSARRLPFQALTSWTLERIVRDELLPDPPRELLVIGLEERLFYRPTHEAQDALGFGLLNSLADWRGLPWQELDARQRESTLFAPLRGLQAPWILPVLYGQGLSGYRRLLDETLGQPPETFRDLSRAEFQFALDLREEIRSRPPSDPAADPLLPLEVAAFERTLGHLAKLPCPVRFVILPVAPEYEAEEPAGFRAFRERILPAVAAAGFEVYDFNRHPELRQAGVFGNPSHLNDIGALSRLLAHAVIAPAVGVAAPADWRDEYWHPVLPGPSSSGEASPTEAPAPPAPEAGAAPEQRAPLTPEQRGEREAAFRRWLAEQQAAQTSGQAPEATPPAPEEPQEPAPAPPPSSGGGR
jgi:hypothetical protein